MDFDMDFSLRLLQYDNELFLQLIFGHCSGAHRYANPLELAGADVADDEKYRNQNLVQILTVFHLEKNAPPINMVFLFSYIQNA